jgi:hypothetical protein
MTISYETLGYGNMTAWPQHAGPPPSLDDIITARAMHIGKPGTKRELAIAAYLRECANTVPTGVVAAALQAVLKGDLNPLHNVANADFERSLQYGRVIKTKVGSGTAYKLQLFEKTQQIITEYRAKFMATVAAMIPTQPVTEVQADATTTALDVSPTTLPDTQACEATAAPLKGVDTGEVHTVLGMPAKAAKGTKGKFKSKKASRVAKTETLTSEAPAAVVTVESSKAVADALVAGFNAYINGVLPDSDNLLLTYQPEAEVLTS